MQLTTSTGMAPEAWCGQRYPCTLFGGLFGPSGRTSQLPGGMSTAKSTPSPSGGKPTDKRWTRISRFFSGVYLFACSRECSGYLLSHACCGVLPAATTAAAFVAGGPALHASCCWAANEPTTACLHAPACACLALGCGGRVRELAAFSSPSKI